MRLNVLQVWISCFARHCAKTDSYVIFCSSSILFYQTKRGQVHDRPSYNPPLIIYPEGKLSIRITITNNSNHTQKKIKNKKHTCKEGLER